MINFLANTSSNIGQAASAQSSTALGKAAHGHHGASSDADSLASLFDSLIQELAAANATAGASASTGTSGGASAAAAASATATANNVSALNQLMQNLKIPGGTATAGAASTSSAQTAGTGPLKMMRMLQHLAQQGAPATLVGLVGGLVNAVA